MTREELIQELMYLDSMMVDRRAVIDVPMPVIVIFGVLLAVGVIGLIVEQIRNHY